MILNYVDWSGRRETLREYGAGETPQALKRRGGSPNRPRKAKRQERKSTAKLKDLKIKGENEHDKPVYKN